MPNRLYPRFKQGLISDTVAYRIHQSTTNVRLLLINSSVHLYKDADVSVSNLGSDLYGFSDFLTSKFWNNQAFFTSAAPLITVSSFGVGKIGNGIIMATYTGDVTNDRLLAYWDSGITGLPAGALTSGQKIRITPPAAGWFAL